MKIKIHRPFIGSASRVVSRLVPLFVVVAITLVSLRAWSFDFIDLASYYSQLRSRFNGYRIDYVSFDYMGQSCTLPIFEHVNAPSKERILLLHGFGGSGMSVERMAINAASMGLPYKNFLMVEWPRHGNSRCDQVQTLSQAVEALEIGLKQVEERPGGRHIKTIVATSLGVAVATALYEKYPAAHYIWISPPVLEPNALNKLITALSSIEDTNGARNFLSRAIADESYQVPDFIVSEILYRIKRAQPLLKDIDREGLRSRLLSIPANQVTVFEGSKDRLIPIAELDPRFKSKYAGVTTVLDGCGHDMVIDCERRMLQSLHDQL